MLAKQLAGCCHLPSAVSKLFDRKARPSAETGRILGVLACLWVRRSRDSRKGWIRNKEIQCLQNTLQDAGIYLQPFPSYSITKPVLRAKNTAAFRHPLSFNPLVRCLPVTTKTWKSHSKRWRLWATWWCNLYDCALTYVNFTAAFDGRTDGADDTL